MKMFLYISLLIFSIVACNKSEQETENVLNVYLEDNISSTDPLAIDDIYSTKVSYQVYEGLYEYHYLKFPYQITPLLADGLPDVSKDGLLYRIKMKKGIEFIDDPCFKSTNGKGREVVAADFIYSIKRYISSPLALDSDLDYFVENVKGLKEFRNNALRTKAANFDDIIDGLVDIDKHTIEIKLKKKLPYFAEILVRPGAFVIAKEAVAYYGSEFGSHPVGTGPFVLKTWEKGSKIIFDKNLKYRQVTYPLEGTNADTQAGLLKDAGKPVPFVDKLVMYILPEEQPRWLNFKHGTLDIVDADKDDYYDAFPINGALSDSLKKIGVKDYRFDSLKIRHVAFNMKDKLIGNNKYLRQAISLAFNFRKHMDLFYNNQAFLANWIIPPGIFGFDINYKNPYLQYDLDRASKLLKKAGYPNGQGLAPLVFDILDTTTQRQFGEFFVKSASEIGINIKLRRSETFSLLKKRIYGATETQIFFLGWTADFVRPENFLVLLYGNSNANHSKFCNKEYDRLFDNIAQMEDNQEKLNVMKKMRDIGVEESVILPLVFPIMFRLTHSYVENYKINPIYYDNYKYVKINLKEKHKVSEQLLKKDKI